MTRPAPIIKHQIELANGDLWQLLHAPATYVITYKNEPVGIRIEHPSLSGNKYKYKRTSYTELGTCIAQVKRFNELFNCTDFDYIAVPES